jgi:hypothetical protein
MRRDSNGPAGYYSATGQQPSLEGGEVGPPAIVPTVDERLASSQQRRGPDGVVDTPHLRYSPGDDSGAQAVSDS